MCLLFFSYQVKPGYPLVVAANRDEFLVRPTAPLGYLDRKKSLLGGRDLRAGGTWLGLTSGYRFAALTNYREEGSRRAGSRSRGEIVIGFLSGKSSPETFVRELAGKADQYNGFNLIAGDPGSLYYYSNRGGGPQRLSPGLYGLSNHLLDTPWPKLLRGKALLGDLLLLPGSIIPARLFALLADRWQPPDRELPESGVSLDWERLLGPIFIDAAEYGTRSSALITLDSAGEAVFYEKTYHRRANGLLATIGQYRFPASSAD
ncbi:MAG TPA: NRDE family protein [Desulforhopalus sp.]|nr:NRDE family protein [Desulforhopalus sp.]